MTDNTEARILATDVIARNDGLHGDPARSPYQWGAALKLARAYLALTAPLDEKYAEIQNRAWVYQNNDTPLGDFTEVLELYHLAAKDRATLLDAIRVVTAEKVEINNTLQMLKSAFALETKELLAARARAETAEAELNVLRSNLGLPQMKWVDDHFEPILEPTPKPQPSAVVVADLVGILHTAYSGKHHHWLCLENQAKAILAAFPTLQHTTVGPGLTEEERAMLNQARVRQNTTGHGGPITKHSSAADLAFHDRHYLLAIISRLLGEAGDGKS